MKLFVIIFLALANSILFSGYASATICDSLSIENIEVDPQNPGYLNITILFDSPNSTHLNYPYVDYVLDKNMDKVADGQMSFFAHMGGYSQTYQVTILSPPLTSLADLTIVFKYNVSDSCVFGKAPVPTSSICDSLSIVKMETDSTQAGLFNITVLFDAPDSIALNYPYVDYILNASNDTIAKGQMNLFAQIGGTSASYQVTVFSPPLDPYSNLMIVFRFNGTDSCVFGGLPANGISESTGLDHTFRLCPNPAKGIVKIDIEPQETEQLILIRNHSGQTVYKQKTFGPTILDISNFSNGIYLVEMLNGKGFQRQKLVVY